ncbi:MAG: type II toxin-antitoxin system Phd/YefM family antitoxin [Firmicutes bacterium]|nr:type II toxin-antitoxin system Phd/YefM family antitoxin [Bacillota bacterium]
MYIVNITEIRQNASKIIARVVSEKEPAIVLQRSKPVAYILEASFYENLQKEFAEAKVQHQNARTGISLETITKVREKMSLGERQPDSTEMIRKFREDLFNE